MQSQVNSPTDKRHWFEIALSAVIVVGIGYCALHVGRYGYLPPPFFYVPSDTYADWFNPAFWARQAGVYDTYLTVYPPLSFVFLRIFGIDRCYPDVRGYDPSSGIVARDCDWVGLATIWLLFALNIYLTWRCFRKIDRRTAPMRTICLALGMPMLSALERGNLLLVTYTCFVLALGPLLSSARLKWLFAGLALNFKVYLIGGFVALLLKRRWLHVEGILIATVLIYLLSYAILGAGSPLEIVANLQNFSGGGAAQILDAWHGFTYLPLMSVIEEGQFPLITIIGSDWVERLQIILPASQLFTQLLIAFAAFTIWLRPDAVTHYRAIALGVLMALVTSESGMYTQIFFVFFVLMEPWKGFGRIWAITMCYLLAIPLDFPLSELPSSPRDTYFTDTRVMIANQVTLWPFIRPLMIMSVAWALALTTMWEVFVAVRSKYVSGTTNRPWKAMAGV